MENPGAMTRDVGAVHGHIPPLLNMAHRHSGLQQGRFKGKAASNEKTHQIIPPKFLHLGVFPGQFPIPIQPVPGQIPGDIHILCQKG